MNRLACALLVAGVSCAYVAAPGRAAAGPSRVRDGLQLSLLTPDPGSVVDRASIDVSFRGGSIDSVELYLDGALVSKRQIAAAQNRGVITFTIETLQLTEGPHDVIVKAFGPDGRAAVTAGKLRVPGMDLNAPVRISYPRNGVQVSGVVPVRIFLDDDVRRQKPYVTFFIDKKLEFLRNYPPYEYLWDTTRTSNGWHMLEAWAQTADSTAPSKARQITINVNNGGGETKKQNDIEDLRGAIKPAAPKRPDATLAAKGANPGVTGKTGLDFRVASRPQAVRGSVRTGEPGVTSIAETARPIAAAEPTVTPNTARIPAPAPRMMGGAVAAPKGRIAIASRPKGTLPGLSQPDELYPVISPTQTGDLLKIEPGDTVNSVARKTGVAARDIARLNNLRTSSRLPAGRSIIVPRAGSFDVAFDGMRIAFDVAPRIESGVRLAPFRQIFEHTGGKLYWYNEVKTVKAINSTRDIEIKVGSPNATVNNSTVPLERAPYIISGRTIVPLTFIRDSLNVKINFDEKTGRLLIESQK